MPVLERPAESIGDGLVFDELHRLFGVGEFVEGDWVKFRMTEIAKVKATRKKNGVEPFELLITIRWCKKHRVPIRAHWQLYEHVREALADFRYQPFSEKEAALEKKIQRAIEAELAGSDSPWVDRLIRAVGDQREVVYAQWEKWCASRS